MTENSIDSLRKLSPIVILDKKWYNIIKRKEEFSLLGRFETHSHDDFSNIRFLDSISKPKNLIDRAIEIGLSGIAITDHECLSSHVEVNKYAQEILKTNPNFKVALGNEIYLCDTRSKNQKYYHFILIAKNKEGHKALKKLSSKAWYHMYSDRGMDRVVTLKSDLEDIVKEFPNCLIAQTACISGELPTKVLELLRAEENSQEYLIKEKKQEIDSFIKYCLNLFGEDFYIEIQPAAYKDQIDFNNRVLSIAKSYGIKMVVSTDSHYLRKEDRYVHKSYLNSKEKEREVDDFYQYCYLMDEEDLKENLFNSSLYNEEIYKELLNNTLEIYNKIENYSLFKKSHLTKEKLDKFYPKNLSNKTNRSTLDYLLASEEEHERYWVNECLLQLEKINKINDPVYLDRLEEEADVIKYIGEQIEDCLFVYFTSVKYFIDIFWECGSIVGPGRGSAPSFLSNYLLGITQVDPIEYNLPAFRFLNKERAELPDVDLDLAPDKIDKIFERVKEIKGELGVVQVATFGTETSKSAILNSMRGYRNDDFPNGFDVDEAQYLSSLAPVHRGFVWEIKDIVYGNEEKDRKPVVPFVKEVEKYPKLLDIMLSIEGLRNKRAIHASGVVLFNDEEIYDYCSIMRAPNGSLITSYSLHDLEYCGAVKQDWLKTEITSKLIKALELLQQDKIIEPELSLKEIYNKYLHPSVLNLKDDRIWSSLGEGEVLDVFQFSTGVGLQAAKKLKPNNVYEMTDANSLMRLMPEKGKESPLDKYYNFKNNINLWYKEMDSYGLTKEEQSILEPYYLPSYGVPPQQEDLMLVLMDKNICNFSLAEANNARKIIGKKLMNKIPELKEQIFSKATSQRMGEYIWDSLASPQVGYAFSRVHSTLYSIIGIQTLVLATNFNPVYWNTACLIVNSGAINEEENDSTDYSKLARAISSIKSRGIEVSPPDINKSGFGFVPDPKNNRILFGLKPILNVSSELSQDIIKNREYKDFFDFLERVPIKKQSMVALIKSGAFDQFYNGDRRYILMLYLYLGLAKKSKVTLQNFNGLINYGLVPSQFKKEVQLFSLTKEIRKRYKEKDLVYTNQKITNYLLQNFPDLDFYSFKNGLIYFSFKDWEKFYKKEMEKVTRWISANQEELIQKVNDLEFLTEWDKYKGKDNLAAWEMESLGFYDHEHELTGISYFKYGLTNFFKLPEEPLVDYTFKKNGKQIPIYKIFKIIGTVIAKDKIRASISLLTLDGVVNVKFNKEYFAMFDKQISERLPDGKKKVREKSWFNKGTILMIQGYRRRDDFVAKRYNKTPGHTLYRVELLENKDLLLQSERYQGIMEDSEE